MHTVLIADRHPLIGNGISHILQTNGYKIIARETTGDMAIKSALRYHPELIIMDIHLPDCHGLEVIRTIREISNNIKIIVLTAYDDLHYQIKCREYDVEGYMLKSELATTLSQMVKEVMDGKIMYPAAPAIDVFLSGINLTPRENAILRHLVSGMSNREIAKELLINEKTVSSHKRKVMRKFSANNLIDLLNKAKLLEKNVLIDPLPKKI